MRSRRPRDHRGRARRDAATSQGTLGPQQTEEVGTAAAGAFGGSVARPHLQGGLVASGTVRQFLSVVWNRPACGCLLSSPRYEHGVTERDHGPAESSLRPVVSTPLRPSTTGTRRPFRAADTGKRPAFRLRRPPQDPPAWGEGRQAR